MRIEVNSGELAGQSLNEAMRYHANGDLERAEKHYVQVLSKEYRTADILPLLAGVVAKRGDTEMALYYWDKLIGLDPRHLTAYMEKAKILRDTGRYDEAINCYQIARSLAPEKPLIRNNLAVTLADYGRKDEAIQEFNQILRLQPGNINAYHQMRRLTASIVPFWHIPMLNDTPRNDAFEAAIRLAIAKVGTDSQILDIGSGSGLLSMMAARAGATNIVTCESVPVIARTAEAIIADNGYSEQIKVVAKKSTEVTVGRDLPEKASVLVSEILSADLLAEHVLATFEDARERLLTEDAVIIPQKATAMGCLVASAALQAHSNVANVSGFDVSRFNGLAPIALPVHGTMTEWTRLSGDFEITAVDLMRQTHEAQLRQIEVSATGSGTVVGVIQWMHVNLLDDIEFSNHPSTYHDGGWLQILHPFPHPIEVEAGERLTLIVGHDRTSLIMLPAPKARADQ